LFLTSAYNSMPPNQLFCCLLPDKPPTLVGGS